MSVCVYSLFHLILEYELVITHKLRCNGTWEILMNSILKWYKILHFRLRGTWEHGVLVQKVYRCDEITYSLKELFWSTVLTLHLYILLYEKSYSYRCPRYGPKKPCLWLCCNSLFGDFLAWFWKVRLTGVLRWLWWIFMQSYSTAHAVVCKYAERTAGRLHQRVHGEGWPLLTVENETNEDSREYIWKGPPWLVLWARHAGTRNFCPVLSA
jgi:hypothetical protein